MKTKTQVKVCFVVLMLLICTAPLTISQATEEDEDEIEVAIEAGLAWLAGRQNPDGSFGYWEILATTAFVVLKFETYAIESGIDPLDESYIYYDQVRGGLDFLFADAHTIPLSIQPAGDPDANGNGLGIYFGSIEHHRIYSTSVAMMALASSTHPEMIVDVSGDIVGKTYQLVLEDTVDYLAFAQNELYPGRGGWGYSENPTDGRSDNSNSGYAVLSLGYAEAPPPYGFGISILPWVKDELNYWIDFVQEDTTGGSGYTDPYYWLNILKTGNLLYQMAFVGDTAETPRVIDAVNFIETHWYDEDYSPGWRGPGPNLPPEIELPPPWLNPYPNWPACYQAMYTTMRGLEVLGIEYISPINDLSGIAWFAEFVEVLLDQQNEEGFWPSAPMFGSYYYGRAYLWEYWDVILSTTWALLTLEKVVPLLEVEAFVDIKPGSWPNPINLGSKGVISIAICGTDEFDVLTVDPASIRLNFDDSENEVAPLRWSYEDTATPYTSEEGGGHDLEGDGFIDLVLKFDTQEIVDTFILTYYIGETIPLIIKGNLKEEYGGAPLKGQDFVRLYGNALKPFVIDDNGLGDYTWKEASRQWWCEGSGTSEDPYIIEYISINGEGSISCLTIQNSDAYFIIKDCRFYNTEIIDNIAGAALVVDSATNGKLLSNDCYNNENVGISIRNSEGIQVLENTCMENAWGIGLTGGFGTGVGLISNTLVENNVCIKNSQYGIVIWDNAENNIVTDNICSENLGGIILAYNVDYNIISDNFCQENTGSGIVIVYDVEYNFVTENLCSQNGGVGIYLNGSASWNEISYNIATENNWGIGVDWDSHNMIQTCYYNEIHHNNIMGNYLASRFDGGIGTSWHDNTPAP
ncbi:MAG: NosD domain-containing protein [Promethearchaeota archaeon]